MEKQKLVFIAVLLIIHIGLCAESLPDFHQTVDAQIKSRIINIPKNTYRLDLANKGTYRFTDMENVHIKGNGSTVICNKQLLAFYFGNCKNVTFSDLYIEYDSPCSTQGTITKITNDNKTLEVEIHEGYPMVNPSLTQNSILIYDGETRELVKNFHTTRAINPVKVDAKTRKVILDIGGAKSGVYKLGDYIDFNNVANGGHAIVTEFCKKMKFEKITLYDSPGMGFVEHGCESSYYYQCEINRKKNYPGRPVEQLRSARADGFHCKFDVVGPTIEECTVKYQGDDVVNISGYFYPVYKVDKPNKKIYVLSTAHKASDIHIKDGDNLVCIGNNGAIRGKKKVLAVEDASAPSNDEKNACLGMLVKIREEANLNRGVCIILDEWIEGINPGDMIHSNDRIGNGFQLLNNDVGHNRSRAFLIKASDGIIKGNKITGSAMSAIAVTPEFFWLEAGCSSNLEIRDNTIRDCMFDEYLVDFGQAGAISVACQTPGGDLAKVGVFENISIYNNEITNCPMPCIFLNAVASGYCYDNRLKPSAEIIRNHGRNFGITNTQPVLEINTGNIVKQKVDLFEDLKAMNNIYTPKFVDFVGENVRTTFKILIIGNSLASHEISHEIGWNYVSGMAASSINNDYAHLIAAKFEDKFPDQKIGLRVSNFASFEREPAILEKNRIDDFIDYNPDVVIFQLGENVDINKEALSFRQKYIELIKYFRQSGNPIVILTTPFFPSLEKNNIIEDVALETNSYLVDLSHLPLLDKENQAKEEKNYKGNRSEWKVDGIGIHPGDMGMEKIAKLLFITINSAMEQTGTKYITPEKNK